MKCPECKGCMKGYSKLGKRYHYCSFCVRLYGMLPGFKLDLLSKDLDEIKNILDEDVIKLLKIE